jgi:hypothetical protein
LENLKTIKEMEEVNLFGITENRSITRKKEVVCRNQVTGMYISIVGETIGWKGLVFILQNKIKNTKSSLKIF